MVKKNDWGFDGNYLFHNKLNVFDKTKRISFVSSNMETYCWKIGSGLFEKKSRNIAFATGK
jgi:hypothetical protein